jgi:hypothetical protein
MRHHVSPSLLTRYGIRPAHVVPVLEDIIVDGRLATPAAIVVDHDIVITIRHTVTIAVLDPRRHISLQDINWLCYFLELNAM